MSDSDSDIVPGSPQPPYNYEDGIRLLLNEFNLIRDLFDFKDILHIGCGEGRITCGIADRFPINTIRGVDLDEGNIERAIRNIVHPGNRQIYFCQEDYVPKTEAELNAEFETLKYDTILCILVTRSIHCREGDEGIELCFKRMYRQLKFGGTLIFESNLWRDYSNPNLAPGRRIQRYPSQFGRLLEGYGFVYRPYRRTYYHQELTLYTKPPLENQLPRRTIKIKTKTPKKRRRSTPSPSTRKLPRKPLRI